MRINTSYLVREGQRSTFSASIPVETVPSLKGIIEHLVWLAKQKDPRVESYEG